MYQVRINDNGHLKALLFDSKAEALELIYNYYYCDELKEPGLYMNDSGTIIIQLRRLLHR